MGNEVSGEGDYYDNDNDNEDEDDYAKQFDGIETLGYRVLGVQPDSPAAKAGLVSFFDFIVGANHKMLLGSGVGLAEGAEYDDVDFPLLLKENIHQPVLLLVYNIKAREQRELQLIPSDDWGGAGLLGVTIKLDDYGGADEKLVRVLEVDDHKGGPAKLAGLIEKEDFLLGTTATTLTNTDVLASLLQMHLERVVELYVYNSTTDLVRIVGLHPTYNWGYGESMLGAAVGTGYLHRLPESCRSTIGKSVERTVSILETANDDDPNQLSGGVGELNLNQSTIRMEGTLEMEPEDEDDENEHEHEHEAVDGDVGLAASRGMQVQPHRLGQVEKKLDHPNDNNNNNTQSTIEPPATPDVKSLPPPPPETPFPEAAPMPPSHEAMPTFSTPQPTPPPPPPPPPSDPSTTQAVPPPPPPEEPVPPPPTSSDPPASNNDDDDEYTDEEGSEYTDEEYTDDEEEETPKAPRSGGLFGFMAPPPKMEY